MELLCEIREIREIHIHKQQGGKYIVRAFDGPDQLARAGSDQGARDQA